MNIKHRFTAATAAAICISILTAVSCTTVYAEPDDPADTYSDETYNEPAYDPQTDQSYEYNNFDNYHDDEYYYDDNYDYDNEYYDDTYTEYNDYDDDYYYDDTQETDETAAEPSDLAPEGSVDTTELTSSDWENMQNSQAASQQSKQSSADESSKSESSKSSTVQPIVPSSTSGPTDFDNIKDNENNQDSNDTWIFLFGGVLLILAGIGITIAVVVVNVKAKHRSDAEEKIAEHTASPIDFETYTPRPKPAPKKDFLGARHAAKSKLKNKFPKGVQPKDLVDTLDQPLDFSNIDKNNLK